MKGDLEPATTYWEPSNQGYQPYFGFTKYSVKLRKLWSLNILPQEASAAPRTNVRRRFYSGGSQVGSQPGLILLRFGVLPSLRQWHLL